MFLGAVAWGVHAMLVINRGRLTYPLDDTYTHLAIAKNLVRHGVWGVSYADGFSSADSSLVWPVLLAACFAVFGLHEYIAFVLAVVSAVGLLVYTALVLRRHGLPGWLNLLVLAAAAYLTPLLGVAATGMEHCLQTLVDLAFIDLAVRTLAGSVPLTSRAARLGLPILAALAVATRYEGLFIVAVVGAFFLGRGWWRPALIFGVAAVAAPTLYGLYSVHAGWYFLPNSLMIKGNGAPLTLSPHGVLAYFSKAYDQTLANPHVLLLGLAMAAAFVAALRRRGTLWSEPALLLAVVLGVTLLHLQYARFGWFYRYEAYLVFLGVVSLGVCLADAGLPARRPGQRAGFLLVYAGALAVAAVAFGIPLIQRADQSLRILALASHNIDEQQIQMGHFLRRFYAGQGVVANDIGAIDYLADIRLFDIFGLADIDVLRARRAGTYGQDLVESQVKRYDARVAIVYDTWVGDWGGIPASWVPVGRWRIRNNVVCGDEVVSFYAPDELRAPELTRALQEFAPSLPTDVEQSGPYRGGRAWLKQLGAYAQEANDEGVFHWVNRAVQFFTFPEDDLGRAVRTGQERDLLLHLEAAPTTGCTALDLSLDGRLLDTRRFPDGAPRVTEIWDLPVRVAPGQHIVRLLGHGEPLHPPNDGRQLLFSVHPPHWRLPAPAPAPAPVP